MDAVTAYGREVMPTLFGRFENGEFIANDNAVISLYNKNAVGILRECPAQFGAPENVKDAIQRFSQKQTNVKSISDRKNRVFGLLWRSKTHFCRRWMYRMKMESRFHFHSHAVTARTRPCIWLPGNQGNSLGQRARPGSCQGFRRACGESRNARCAPCSRR